MITVYTKPQCPQCVQAKKLLEHHQYNYQEVHIDAGQPKVDGVQYISRDEFLATYPTIRTVPFIIGGDGAPIGGFQDLRIALAIAA
jgi:glutaredoxin